MEILRLASLSSDRLTHLMQRANARIFAAEVTAVALGAIEDVRRRGDEAVLDYTRRWDQVSLSRDRLVVASEEVEAARAAIPLELRAALTTAIDRTRRFNERLKPANWLETVEEGIAVGIQFTPLEGVGVYIPSGKGRFPSTCVTLLTPAVVAGVPDIRVLVPPRRDGTVDPAVLVACDLLGVRSIVRCNGVAGIAALAVGTESIPPAPAIVGPGNPYVVATQLAAQAVGVRMLALLGPTEAMVLADETADPRRLALDLVNEAEHGTDSAAVLITDSEAIATEVVAGVTACLRRLPEERARFARAALTEFGGVVCVPSMGAAIDFVNAYAPEHLQIATRDPLETLRAIRHAGEVLLGQDTPFAAGNYAIGVPAALPTGGSARVGSGVTVLSFLKTSSIAQLDATGLAKVRPIVEQLGTYEGFPAHVMAVVDR